MLPFVVACQGAKGGRKKGTASLSSTKASEKKRNSSKDGLMYMEYTSS